ncbi:glycoside hydrolase superfamily [Lasiosphaeris hirsuta]|uniref:Glycoside hydrolase superfamily n=1 Tax=Lasiosphaeris hirsuta TaxID=260670 RepID=A0AA40E445_9PEZI|nr:glycoside hydrolase superfamily [Lasiosphaeris hirsuta]
MLIALVALRTLLVIENSGIDYLGPPSTYGCATAAKRFTRHSGLTTTWRRRRAPMALRTASCPPAQAPDVTAYFQRFFFNQTANTNFLKTDGKFQRSLKQWADWALPELALNAGWRFQRTLTKPDGLIYDLRPDVAGQTGLAVPYVQSTSTFNDSAWEAANLPHDWAIKGPFYAGDNVPIGGGMGRLPSQGVACGQRRRGLALRIQLVPAGPDALPRPGRANQLAIRLDNPVASSRWYPGGGIYRNVVTREVGEASAVVDLTVEIENKGVNSRQIEVVTDMHVLDAAAGRAGAKIAEFRRAAFVPTLWGPWNTQQPNLYVAVTRLHAGNTTIDAYETRFGIRELVFDPDRGLLVNDEHVGIQGVNQHHHDLSALGAAFNLRAAERQLEVLRDLGANAIRVSHNPPAPELLDLTDRMGFLVVNEIFDCWEREKNANDFHLIFPEWSEPDLRSSIRRDHNHASVVAWSVGNEVGEQYTAAAGAAIGRSLRTIPHDEDPTRPATASMNYYAKPDMPFPREIDILIFSSETAAAVSTRGTYLFPVANETSAPVSESVGGGGSSESRHVSAYELYTTPFGSSADKVFATQDANLFVAGEFVWSGWAYLGEPTPYYSARSSTAHILPHWAWPDWVGQVTPVHDPSNYRFRWDKVVYQPRELRVVTRKEGRAWVDATVRTVGVATKLRLTADRGAIRAEGSDLSFITIEVVDSSGEVVPRADAALTVSLTGRGEIVATDNGDPSSLVGLVRVHEAQSVQWGWRWS